MNIFIAKKNDFAAVKKIIHETINNVYRKFYPTGAVEFFLNHHSDINIRQAIENNEVYLFEKNGCIIGTGSMINNHIARLFILPQFQAKGYGTIAMDFFEATLFEKYSEIYLDASFPAYSLYLKRGYKPIEYHKILTDNGDYLCYHVMKLCRPN